MVTPPKMSKDLSVSQNQEKEFSFQLQDFWPQQVVRDSKSQKSKEYNDSNDEYSFEGEWYGAHEGEQIE